MSDRSSTSGDGTGVPEVDSMSGAYVLNALNDEERELFEARIRESDEIRMEVTELNETALLLGRAVQPVAPSAALRASIMDLIESTPQLPALPAEAQANVAQATGAQATGAQANGAQATDIHAQEATQSETDSLTTLRGRHADPVTQAPRGELLAPIPLARQRWFMRPAVLLAGAAAAVALIFGGVVVGNNIGYHPASSNQAIGTDASQILSASDVQHTVADVSTGGKATVYWSAKLQRSAVILDGVTSLPSDKTYQLWYIKGTSIKSAGTFAADSNNAAQVLQGDLVKGDTVGITVEPSGGSKQPTTKPIVAIPV